MDPGDMKDMFKLAIKDAAPRRATIVNNKAEAVTITLIDFVRSMVLKTIDHSLLKDNEEICSPIGCLNN